MHRSKRDDRPRCDAPHHDQRTTATLLGDRGSAPLEFLTAGLLLLLPVVYLVLVMAQVQAGALAVEGAARHAARVYVLSASPADAAASATTAVEFTLDDYGLDPSTADIRVDCSPVPTDCLARRGFVTVTVSTAVALPLAPPFFASAPPLSIALSGTATQQVSRFRLDG